MVRNYIQFKLRASLVGEHQTILNRKKQPDQNPTTETALRRFRWVMGIRFGQGQEAQRRVQGLNEDCLTMLRTFGLDEAVFTSPYKKRVRKKVGGPPPTPGT